MSSHTILYFTWYVLYIPFGSMSSQQLSSLSLSLPAVSGSDYVGITVVLQFSDSITRQCVNITLFQEGDLEPLETFTVNLTNSNPLVTLGVSTAVVIIRDSDSENVIVY